MCLHNEGSMIVCSMSLMIYVGCIGTSEGVLQFIGGCVGRWVGGSLCGSMGGFMSNHEISNKS